MDQEVRSSELFSVLANLMDSQSHGMQSSQNNNNNSNPENSLRHNAIGTDTSLTENSQVETAISQAMNAHIMNMAGQSATAGISGTNGSASDAEIAELERISAFMIPTHGSNDALYEATSHIGMTADVGNVLDTRLPPYTSNAIDFTSSQSQALLGDLNSADASVANLSCAQSYVSLLQQQSVDMCGNLWPVNTSGVSVVGNFNGNSVNNKQHQQLGNPSRTQSIHAPDSLASNMQSSSALDKLSPVTQTQHRPVYSTSSSKVGQRMQHSPRMVSVNKRSRATQPLNHNATTALQYNRVNNKNCNNLVLPVNHDNVQIMSEMEDHRNEKKLTTTPIPSDDKSSCGSTSSGSLSGPERSPDHPTERPSSSRTILSQNTIGDSVLIANKLPTQTSQKERDGHHVVRSSENAKNYPCYGNMNVLNFGTINFTPVMDNTHSNVPSGDATRNGQDDTVPVPTSDSIIEIAETVTNRSENIPMSPTTPTCPAVSFADVQKMNFSNRGSFAQMQTVTTMHHAANAESQSHTVQRKSTKSKGGDQLKKPVNGHRMADANNNLSIPQGYDKDFTSLATVTQDKLQEKLKKPHGPKHRQTLHQRQEDFHSNVYAGDVNQFNFSNVNTGGQPSHLKPKVNADPTTKMKSTNNSMSNNQFNRPPPLTSLMAKNSESIPSTPPYQASISQEKNVPAHVETGANRPSPGKLRQWQTVTAVQGPKLPPMLSEQDRIPKRGRPSKKTMQENLKVKKDAVATNTRTAPPVVTQRSTPQKPTPPPPPPPIVSPPSLVSTYTINDKGLMEEIAPKAKENRRSKERTQAFLKYLDEIKMYSKQQQTVGNGKGGDKEKTNGDKQKKRSRSRTKVFGRSITQPLTESGITETMYTFSALAHQFKISTSIVERATENLLKSAAVKRNKEQQNAMVAEHQRLLEKNTNKNYLKQSVVMNNASKGVPLITTSHCEAKTTTSSKLAIVPTPQQSSAALKTVDEKPAAIRDSQHTNSQALTQNRVNLPAAPSRTTGANVGPKISASGISSRTIQNNAPNAIDRQIVPKATSSVENTLEPDLLDSAACADEHGVKEKHRKKKHKKHKKHKYPDSGSGKKKKKDKERKKKSKKKLKTKLANTVTPSSSVSLVKPATRPVLNVDTKESSTLKEVTHQKTSKLFSQEKSNTFSSGFRQSSPADIDNSSSWHQDDNTYDVEDSSSDENSTSPKSCIDATSESFASPTPTSSLSSFAQYSNSQIGFGTFSMQKTPTHTETSKMMPTSTPTTTSTDQSDSTFVTQSLARSNKKHSKHKKKKFFRKSKTCDPAFVAILDGLLINLKNLKLDLFSKRNQLSLTHPNGNIFLATSTADTQQCSLWRTSSPKTAAGTSIVKSTIFPQDNRTGASSSRKTTDANKTESGFGKNDETHDASNPITSLSVFCRSVFFQKYGFISTSQPNTMTPFQNDAFKQPRATTPQTKAKEITKSKANSKAVSSAKDLSKKTTPLQNKADKPVSDETSKKEQSDERQPRRKRGWPRGKPRGPRAKRGRFSSKSRLAETKILKPSPVHPKTTNNNLATATDDTNAGENSSQPKQKSAKPSVRKDSSTSDVSTPENQATKPGTSEGDRKVGKDLSKLVGESLLLQIKQAIEANLPAHPSVNKDAITKSVDAAVQSYLENITKTQQESSPSAPEDKTPKKKGRRQSRNTSHEDADSVRRVAEEALPKTNTDRHPKKVWAYKHQDTESSSSPKSQGSSGNKTPLNKKRGPGRPRKIHNVTTAVDKRTASKNVAETKQGKVPTASATVMPTKRRLLTVRIQGKCVKPAVKRLLARAKKDIATREAPKPAEKIRTRITKEDALACLSALCSIKAAKVIAKSGDKDGNTNTGFYAGTVIEKHITEAVDTTVRIYSWDNYKRFEEACFEVEKEMEFMEDSDLSLGDNRPKNPVLKKSIESVVEKLKNKQAQSMHSAAAALLELHNTPSTSYVNSHSDDNVVVIDSSNPDTLEQYRMPGRRQDIYEKVSSIEKDSNSSSKQHKVKTTRLLGAMSSNRALKRPRGRPKKQPVLPDEEPQLKKSKTEKHSAKDAKQNSESDHNKTSQHKGIERKSAVNSGALNPTLSPRKPFLEAGLYSSTFKRNPKSSKVSTLDAGKLAKCSAKLPPPFDAGLFLRSSLKDFQLPYDIWWMYKHRKISVSQDPSTNFVKITENIYSNPRPALDLGDHICTCSPQDGDNCGKGCLNRLMYIECQASSCLCSSSCTNQVMQKRQWCNGLERFKTKDKGWGVKTTNSIREGSFVLEYVGEVVSEAEFRMRTVELYHAYNDHYCVQLDSATVIDGYSMGNEGRFINHSCEPNCEMQKWCVNGEHRIGLFALRAIQPNEELTYDYNFHAYNIDTQQVCRCGTQKCRGFIGGRGQRSSSTDSDASITGPSCSTNLPKPSGKQFKAKTHKAKDDYAPAKEFSILQTKPISKSDKEIIRSRQLFLLRNLGQVRRKEEEQRRKIEKKSGVATSSSTKPNHKSKPKKSHQSKQESEKLDAALTEMYTAIATCKDQNGVSVAIPFMNLPSKKKNPEYYERISDPIDLSVIERNLMSNHYKDIEIFNSDVQRVFKNAEKYHGRKSTLGKDVIRLRKAYANARGAAMLLLNGHKKPTKSSDVSDEDLDDSDENIHRKNEDHIRCICCIYKDEGLMVQCEKCYVWQHCDCMGVEPDNADRYLCEECDPRPFSKEVKVVPSPPNTPPGHTYFLTLLRDDLLLKQGDCAYLMRDHRLRHNSNIPSMRASHRNLANIPPDKLDIFRVEQLWTDERGDKYAYGYHFLRPHETHHAPSRTFYHNELFASPFYEIIPLEAVVGLCCVMDLYTFCKGKPKEFKMSDIYVCDFRIDKAAGLFTCIKKKRYPVCTKPHVFDTYKHKLCPKKDFQPHQVPEQYRKTGGRTPTGNGTSEPDVPEFVSLAQEDGIEKMRRRSEDSEDSVQPPQKEDFVDKSEMGSSVWKKRQRIDGIAHKLLSKLPKQAVDISYLLEPGTGKRQRKKTQLSLESLSQRK